MAADDKVARGLTAGKQAGEERLGQSADQFRTLVESSPNAVVLAAADGSITLLNRQAEAMFGYARDELVGRSVDSLVPERFRERHPAYRADFVAAPQQRPMGAGRDLFALRRDGSELPVEIGLTPIKMPEGLFVLATITDITERKGKEEQLKAMTAELARSNEELEQFAHVVSHDLQEPLRVISQHLRIVRRRLEERLDDESRQSMDFAVDAANRMQALIRGILAYSVIGRAAKEFTTTDMEAVLMQAMSDLASNIAETGASIRHDPLPTVKADSLLMSQLVQNLLSNAIKFCAAGRSPVIRVGAQRDAGGWTFFVEDNGIGMAPEKLERVFKMFYRLHSSEQYPGTGIGLSICKKIVDHHGGRLWVRSALGQGSTFFFTIPDRL